MAYERQYYTNGDVLNAEQLNHMEAGIKENSDSVSKLSEDIDTLKEKRNIVDWSQLKTGYTINGSGVVTQNADWNILDYFVSTGNATKVCVKEWTPTSVSSSGKISLQFSVCCYDEDFNFLRRLGIFTLYNTGDTSTKYIKEVDLETDVKYIKLCVSATAVEEDCLCATFDDFTEYYTYGYSLKDSVLVDTDTIHNIYKKFNAIEINKDKTLRICLVGDIHYGECGGGYNPNNAEINGDAWDFNGEYVGATKDERLQLLVDTINAQHQKRPFDFVLLTGDLAVEYGTENQTEFNNPFYLKELFTKYFTQLPCPIYACAGNHDCFTNEDWQEITGLPRQYSFETDDLYFVVLDTFSNINMGANLEDENTKGIGYSHIDFDFLENEVSKASNKKVVIVAHTITDNPYSTEGGTSDQSKMQNFVNTHKNVFLSIIGHSHKYFFKDIWGIKQLNAGHFCYPTKQWCDGYNNHSNLWCINILQVNDSGNKLETIQVLAEHDYVGMGLDIPTTFNNIEVIADITQREKGAMFYASKYDKKYYELTKTVESLSGRISALEN